MVLVWPRDSEANNRKATKPIKEVKESGSIDENQALLNACPDVVHIGKKLHRSLANWRLWLIPVDSTLSFFVSFVMMHTK